MSKHLVDTEFWHLLMRDVFGPREGGAIVVIDAENARKGVAKTSCMAALSRAASTEFGYGLRVDDGVLSGKGLIERYRDHPGEETPSVIGWDEAVGAGSGDARRAMSHENVELGRAWQLLRTKRILTFVTLPDWNELDPRLQKMADYRVHVSEWPIGEFKAYKSGTTFQDGSVVTYGLGPGEGAEPISFPNMDRHDDPFYNAVTRKKDELIHSGTFDAGETLADGGEEQVDPKQVQREQKIEIAQRMREAGDSTRDIADIVGTSQTWVVENTESPDD